MTMRHVHVAACTAVVTDFHLGTSTLHLAAHMRHELNPGQPPNFWGTQILPWNLVFVNWHTGSRQISISRWHTFVNEHADG